MISAYHSRCAFATVLATCLLTGCDDDSPSSTGINEEKISLSTHELTLYRSSTGKDYLVVFESGLGDGASVWNEKSIPTAILPHADVLVYDRAGYEKSTSGPAPRDIPRLSSELEKVIDHVSQGRKVILVGHSLGGMIIRDYAVHHSSKTAALIFVDSSHEDYNILTQAQEDEIYSIFKTTRGEKSGAAMEATQLIEDTNYTQTLVDLPNIPVVVLTSIKTDTQHDAADRQQWFNAHATLGAGVSDFEHVTTTSAGHYIQREQPALVIDNIKKIIQKLP